MILNLYMVRSLVSGAMKHLCSESVTFGVCYKYCSFVESLAVETSGRQVLRKHFCCSFSSFSAVPYGSHCTGDILLST